ncbi:enolase C-terminal domain-like protein [Streptomyces sp. NBC_00670]|uniref:enolase C-terminal domain-like protein n=1 Tax=Streptomyces sp. NBC_00670 TaxID=2975804 RepID=UPI002E33BBB1|nr:enolase C-terminal domain-like protein [Streptomyces sp. NBC_00670]
MAWTEEPLISDDLVGHAMLRDLGLVPIATGEHEFTRHGFRYPGTEVIPRVPRPIHRS